VWRVWVSDLGSQICCWRFQHQQRGKYLLRFQEIRPKSSSGRRPLNTIVARRSSALLTAPSVAKNHFGRLCRTICSQFSAKFKAKSAKLAETMSKKMDGLARKEGRWYQYRTFLCADAYVHAARTIRIDADAGSRYAVETIATIDAHTLACFCSCCCCCCCGQIHAEKRDGTEQGGLSICSEVFWKLPKNNKLSVLEVVKLGKSYNWLVHRLLAIYVIYKHISIYHTYYISKYVIYIL